MPLSHLEELNLKESYSVPQILNKIRMKSAENLSAFELPGPRTSRLFVSNAHRDVSKSLSSMSKVKHCNHMFRSFAVFKM